MPDYVYELLAKIGLDDEEFQRQLLEDGRTMNNTAAEITTKAQQIQKGMLMITAAGAAAVGAFAVSSVQTAATFDSAMSQVAATLGITTSDIENNVDGAGDRFQMLEDKALEMGKSTKFTATEAAEGLNILAMSGYDAAESVAMIEDVLHLAAAGSMDMASAAAYISGAMKGFNDESKTSADYADLMAKGATLANTSVTELGEALSDSAAVAASYNQTAESTTLALLRLAEQGETGSAAGTALAAAMKNLFAPTDQAKKKLEELGVSVYDANGKQRDFNDIVNDLQKSMSGLTEEEKTANAQLIFGIQGFNAYNKMVVTSTEKQNEWADALANSTGEAAKQYETMTDNLEGDIDKLKSAWEGFKIEIGKKLMPIARRLVQWLTDMIDNIDKFIPIITAAASAFTTFSVAINITSMIKKVKLAFQALSALFVANPIALAIAAVVAAIVLLWTKSERFRDFITGLIRRFQIMFWSFSDRIRMRLDEMGIKFEDISATIKKIWEILFSFFETTVIYVFETIATYIETALDVLIGIFDIFAGIFTGDWDRVWQGVQEVFTGIWDGITGIFENAWNAFTEIADTLLEAFGLTWDEFWGACLGTFTEIWEGIKTAFSDAWEWISDQTEEQGEMLKGKWDAIKTAYEEHGGGLEGAAAAFMQAIKERLTLGWDAINTLTGGKLDILGEKIKDIFEAAKKTVKDAIKKLKDLLKFDWKLPKLKMPHFSWTWEKVGNLLSLPKISVSWYRKAYESPYIFNKPTVLQGFGDGAGGEIVYGHQNLLQDIRDAVGRTMNQTKTALPPINITNLVELDGAVLARKTYRYSQEEISRHGSSLITA